MKAKFIKLLREFGFRRIEKYADDILPYSTSKVDGEGYYAEVHIWRDGCCSVWMPSRRYIGDQFEDLDELRKHLTELINPAQ